ncbi:hypothetical protein D5R81_15630 [Parashewanella spongiae]|uniref:Uncharacterized protein n=1 Tax=Parashewanella spongiae TaxID=342950 RepID=A0A3A6THY0_9GAMM|nr:hypothetical protein [Parashewanella spongiae]MCL1080247.1 hypothetical protein [Parashewanella spongiae]RJY07530.1 hypothetical protein D5R81_15630 [Parashewanella spongiae]
MALVAKYTANAVYDNPRRFQKMLDPNIKKATALGLKDWLIDVIFRKGSKAQALKELHHIMHSTPADDLPVQPPVCGEQAEVSPMENIRHHSLVRTTETPLLMTYGKYTAFQNLRKHLKTGVDPKVCDISVDKLSGTITYSIAGRELCCEYISDLLRSVKRDGRDYFANYGQEVIDFIDLNKEMLNEMRIKEGKKTIKSAAEVGADELLDVSIIHFKKSEEANELVELLKQLGIGEEELSTTVFDTWVTSGDPEALKKYNYTTFVTVSRISQKEASQQPEPEESFSRKRATINLARSLSQSVKRSIRSSNRFIRMMSQSNESQEKVASVTESLRLWKHTMSQSGRHIHPATHIPRPSR